MASKIRKAGNLELLGGPLCLNFTNTVNTRIPSRHHDYLAQYTDLIEWGRHVGILSQTQTKHLEQEAKRDPARAAELLNQTIVLRETIYRIFVAFARRETPATTDIKALNAEIKKVFGALHIVPFEKGLQWDWDQSASAMDRLLYPVVKSAADLLTSDRLPRVKQCANREHCDWMFLDTSKNQSRRWCCMRVCGSRNKSRQYYHKKRAIS